MNDMMTMLKDYIAVKQRPQTDKKSKIFADEIKMISSQIACVDMWFQIEDDADLLEACIYERESLQARYRYLIRKAKETQASMSPF